MTRPWLETALVAGVICQIASIRSPSKSSGCSTESCTADLCRDERNLHSHMCDAEDEGCQIKGSKVCNMTVQSTLEQFPSLQGCLCAWEMEVCTSLQALATQCYQKPVHDRTDSCLQQITSCIEDEVCNRNLVHVIQACEAEKCNSTHCQRITQQFYEALPDSVAEMLVMCECETGDEDCLSMKSTLHSGTCQEETWSCLDRLKQCQGDRHCSKILKALQDRCWMAEDRRCGDDDSCHDDCMGLTVDPAVMLSTDEECRKAFVATVGTSLQYPCTCSGLHGEDLLKCNTVQDILHNRSRFTRPQKKMSASHKLPDINEPALGHRWLTDPFLSVFAYGLLIGVVLLATTFVFYIVGILRKPAKTKYHIPEKIAVL